MTKISIYLSLACNICLTSRNLCMKQFVFFSVAPFDFFLVSLSIYLHIINVYLFFRHFLSLIKTNYFVCNISFFKYTQKTHLMKYTTT